MMYQNKNGSMLILKNTIDDNKSDDKKPIGIVTEETLYV